jgi:uncharacterized membrane protein
VGQGTINGQGHAFLWQIGTGAPTDLGLLKGGVSSGASAINNNATVQVAGTCVTTIGHDTKWNPFLWTSPVGPMTALSTLKGAIATYAYALNDLRSVQVVGSSDPGSPGYALLWQNGQVIDLNTQIPSNSGWSVLVSARGINDNGWIVGYGQRVSGPPGTDHAFLLTPTAKTALIATSTATAPALPSLSQASMAPLLTEALGPSATAGIATNSQNGVQVPITDLPGALLGEAVSQTIYLDANGAGWGWFVDSTPTNVHHARHSGRARLD